MANICEDEREMTRNQRGLVYTCFEEGQYESGIAALELLRSPAFRPPSDIIRQLLYIALYPPPRPSPDRFDNQDDSPFSPIKGSPSKQKQLLQKASFTPTVTASEAAQTLLLSFLSTNSPYALFRGLPSYTSTTASGDGLWSQVGNKDYDEDSVIARESLCIKNSKYCWDIVKEGFIQRKKLVPFLQEGRGKRQRIVANVEDEGDVGNSTCSPPATVAEHAWLVLEWLVSLFEKDERNTKTSDAKYSPLLLLQIPLPRGTFSNRREVDAPLDIVFYCLEQNNTLRREMGTRLFTQLINLTVVDDFDTNMFTAAVITRLHSSAPEVIQRLITTLPKTTLVLNFQVTLCLKYLSGASDTGSVNQRTKPHVRAKSGFTTNSGPTQTRRENSSPVPAIKPHVASCNDILQLVESQKASSFVTFTMKYVLLSSYSLLQTLALPDQQDHIWKDVLVDGRLMCAISTGFPDFGEGSEYKHTLPVICGVQLPT